jgi:hypothetical protein
MKAQSQKIRASTQKFTEIKDIVGNVVYFLSNDACMVIEIKATNFPLLSKDEQNGKILSYSSLLNSLSFPIQIFIRSKKIDVSSYIGLLDQQVNKTHNELLRNNIKLYKDFVQEMVRENTILDKKFYMVIPYYHLEGGSAQARLVSKSESLLQQLKRVNLGSKILTRNELVELFHEVYNEDIGSINQAANAVSDTTIKQKR